MKHSFGSDNHSGIHPVIMKAIERANCDFTIAYGEDEYSKGVLNTIENLLGGDCTSFFALNGTGANILALSSMVNSYESVICPSTAHINTDECGSPEKIIGCKLIPIPHKDGKVSPEEVKKYLTGFGAQHHSQPKVLSISQPTELGTLYTVEEIKALASLMHSYGCLLHIDGSRISNAAAALKLPVKAMTADAGADALSFGGTKNGMMIGEAVILFHGADSTNVPYLRKQMTQLYSKTRFIAAQFEAYLKDDLYLSLADHSNKMAKYLEERLKEIKTIQISRPVESNAVFAFISKEMYEKISQKHFFYIWDEETMEVRWMCSFNTTKKNIDDFINDIKAYNK